MKSLSPAFKTVLVCCFTVLVVLLGIWGSEYAHKDEVITLHGASLFDDRHSYTQALVKFAGLVQQYYHGPEKLRFVLHKNSELGTEKEYFGYMNIGAVVDYAIVAPSHGSTFSSLLAVMDIPFLFRDTDHYLKTMESDAFKRVEKILEERADVLTLGYGGGEKRHFFGHRPVRNMKELQNFYLRVMGSPIQSHMFASLGAAPTVISVSEVYNAIQTGVIEGAENSASAINQFKWYEVAQDVSLSAVSIIIRPLFFSGKRFRKLPPDLQAAIRKAGAEAMEFERHLEIAIDDPLMKQLEEEGKIRLHNFEEREELLRRAEPVKETYAREIGAYDILQAINAIQ